MLKEIAFKDIQPGDIMVWKYWLTGDDTRERPDTIMVTSIENGVISGTWIDTCHENMLGQSVRNLYDAEYYAPYRMVFEPKIEHEPLKEVPWEQIQIGDLLVYKPWLNGEVDWDKPDTYMAIENYTADSYCRGVIIDSEGLVGVGRTHNFYPISRSDYAVYRMSDKRKPKPVRCICNRFTKDNFGCRCDASIEVA